MPTRVGIEPTLERPLTFENSVQTAAVALTADGWLPWHSRWLGSVPVPRRKVYSWLKSKQKARP